MGNDGKLYISDEAFDSLSRGNVNEVAERLQSLDSNDGNCEEIVSSLYCDILVVFEDGGISLDTVLSLLSETITSDLFARVFCMVLGSFPNTHKLNDLLVKIVEKDNMISTLIIATHVGSDFIRELGALPNDTVSKAINIGTRDHFYTQSKFNLIHEELEGYAKLHNDLYHVLRADTPTYEPQYALEIIDSLIGHYNLDPNRCLDVFLNVSSSLFVCRSQFILQILKASRWWPSKESDNSSLASLSVGGNSSAAKILALESSRASSDCTDFASMSCYLIKEGFISFGHLWSLLQPLDQDMVELSDEYNRQLNDKVSRAGANALANAAPLMEEDEENPASVDILAQTVKSTPEVTVQKLTFDERMALNPKFRHFKQCLALGLYWPSLFILKSYPFLANVDDETTALINRLSDACISPLYADLKCVPLEIVEDVLRRKNNGKILRPPEKFWSLDASNLDLHYAYFDASWDANTPKVTTTDGLFAFSNEFMKFCGTGLSQDLVLFQKLCRIGRHALELDSSPESKEKWFHYIRNYIFPALALVAESSVVVDEAYQLLAHYPVSDRYCLYGELYQVLAKNNPYIKMAYAKAEKATRNMLKRLSKENVRQMTRRFAKLTVANPLPCFLVILLQIESYDNLISLVVESARYFNRYGWDVLTAAILMRLTAHGRSAIQEDGMNDRRWLQSLASFVGKICEKYPLQIDLRMLISYILKSFHAADNSPLVVVREILSSMGGMQPTTNLTARQVNVMGCGASLEKIVLSNIGDRRYDRSVSGNALIDCLVESNCVIEPLVLFCGMLNDYKDETTSLHLKVVAAKLDDAYMVTQLFVLMITFFGQGKSLHLVPIEELVDKYAVDLPWAFELWRPILLRQILEQQALPIEAWKKTMEPLSSQMAASSLLRGYLRPSLFVSFWVLSLHDINWEEAVYLQENRKLEAATKALKEFIHISANDQEVPLKRIQEARSAVKTNEEILGNIPSDMQSHKEHNEYVASIIEHESAGWFQEGDGSLLEENATSFLQECVLPRSIHSAFDAVFSARFLFKLRSFNLQGFSLMHLLDQLINGELIFASLFTMTPTEAENFGLFFAELLKNLSEWSCAETFAQIKFKLKAKNGNDLSHDEYRQRLFDYHTVLLTQLELALQSTEYMCRQNTITFLKNLLGIYPVVEDHCERIVELIQNILNTEEREDLKLSSSALWGHIMSKSADWIHMWDFISMSPDKKEEHTAKRKLISDEKIMRDSEAKKKAQMEKEEAERALKHEEEEKKRQNQIDYDEKSTSSNSTRELRANPPSSRGRYDNYTPSKSTTPMAGPDTTKSTPTAPSTKIEDSSSHSVRKPTNLHSQQIERVSGMTPVPMAPKGMGSSISGASGTRGLSARVTEQSNREQSSAAASSADTNGARNRTESDSHGSGPDRSTNLDAHKHTEAESSIVTSAEMKTRPNIKEKLLEAKRELESKKSESTMTPAAKRAPLPPQWMTVRESDGIGKRLSGVGAASAVQSEHNANGAAPPLPPPPTPPPMNTAATSGTHGSRFSRGGGSGSQYAGSKNDGQRYNGRRNDNSHREDNRKRGPQGSYENRNKRARY